MLRWVAWLVLSSGCAGKDGLAPVADAGPDHLITVGDTATLDATGSSDADGTVTAYRWELLSWPEDSQATLAGGGATPSLTVDAVGRYVISLVAVDNDKQSSIPDIVEVVATTPAQRPVARIELDGVIAVGQPIGLDGSGSTTPNPSAELEYAFSLAVTPMGSEAVIAGADDAARATFTPDAAGLYIAALTVSDGVLPSRAETVEVMVTSAPNRPPVADCGGDQEAAVGQVVRLDGSASVDPEGQPLTAEWALTTPLASVSELFSTSDLSTGFKPDVLGTYTASLVVSDGVLKSAPCVVAIQAVEAASDNRPPVASAGADRTAPRSGVSVEFDGTESFDPDGDTLTVEWTVKSSPVGSALGDGAVFGTDTLTPSFSPDADGRFVVQIAVCDPGDRCDTDIAVVSVGTTGNRAPTANAGPDRLTEAGRVIALDGAASSDPDGDPLEFKWSLLSRPVDSGAIIDAADTPTPLLLTDAEGAYVVQLIVNDGALTAVDLVTITAGPRGVNQPPQCASLADQTTDMGVGIAFDGAGSYDPNGDPLTYAWSTTAQPPGAAPQWRLLDTTSASFTPDLPGTYTVQLTVSDGEAECASTAVVTSIDTTPNTPPTCDAGGDATVYIGESVTLDARGSSDADGDTLSFAWSVYSRPGGSTVVLDDDGSGVVTFDPDVTGVYEVQLTVYDGEDSCSELVVVDVLAEPVNTPPVCDAGGDQAGVLGDTFALDGRGSIDADGDALSFEWRVVERPEASEATIDGAAEATASFLPDRAGTYRIQIRVSDGEDTCDATVFLIVDEPNRAPECAATIDGSGLVGDELTLDASGTIDPDGDALTYQWRVIERPDSSASTIDAVTLRITTFTPDAAGTYRVKVTASDGVESCETIVEIVAERANEPPVCVAGEDLVASVGDVVALDASATTDPDGDALVYQWRIIDRPEGSVATVDAVSLRITSFSPDVAGAYTIRIIVSDGDAECRDDLVLTVESNEPPVCDAGSDRTGVVGDAVVLDASGTVDPEGAPLIYQWRIIDRPADSTATIDAVTLKVTSFSPDRAGTYTIRLIVDDGLNTCRTDIELDIEPKPNAAPVCDAGDDRAAAVGSTVVLNGSGTTDADGDPLTFFWRIIDRPAGSTATIDAVTLKVTSFTPDAVGSYVIRMFASDGTDECRTDVVLTTTDDGFAGGGEDSGIGDGPSDPTDTGTPPTGPLSVLADAGRDLILCDTSEVALDGSDSTGEALDYSWRFATVPSESLLTSADIVDAASATPRFTPDAEGRYELELTVANAEGSDTDLVAVTLSADGSVVILHLDEETGAVAADGSPAGNDADIVNPQWTGGRFFGGLAFDGESYLTIADDDSLDLSGSCTIDWWMRTDDVGTGWRSIMTKGDAYNYSLWTNQDELYFYGVTTSGSYVFAAGETETIGDGAWHHYAATVDGDAMTVFVDGIALASETLSEPLLPNDDDLFLGRPAYSTSTDMFRGSIDEVIIREGALTPDQIAIIADADTQFCTGDEDSLEPDASIVTPSASTETEIGYIKVVGTANDESAIAGVSVNGATAVATSDNYADWVAYVPLAEGFNRLEVQVQDVAGNINTDADDIGVTFNDVCGEDTVLLLAFDESTDDAVVDWGPTGAPATAEGVERVIGLYGNALQVAGSGSVQVPHSLDLEGGGPWTIELWMRREGPSTDLEVIAAKGDPSTYGLALFGDTLLFGFSEADGTEWAATATGVTDGSWHHIAGVYDGGELALYVDGLLSGTTPTFGAVPAVNTTPIAIGSYLGLGAAFTGQLDQLRMYDEALSASEVVDAFTDGEACPIGGNLALGASASATSTLNPLFTADNAIDDDTQEAAELDYSMWLGADGAAAWVELDFGAIVGVLRIRWANTHNRTYYNRATADYRIVASPTGAFGDEATTLATGTGTLETDLRFYTEESSPVAARYLRFYADSFEGLGPGLNELQVYGLE